MDRGGAAGNRRLGAAQGTAREELRFEERQRLLADDLVRAHDALAVDGLVADGDGRDRGDLAVVHALDLVDLVGERVDLLEELLAVIDVPSLATIAAATTFALPLPLYFSYT